MRRLSFGSAESQRGQTLPFWTIGVLIVLSMLFFLANYVNTILWQFRAQNAADSAASAALSVTANLWNEESTILYSSALDEYRIRYLNQALLNTIYGQGGCDPAPGGSCDQDYQSLKSELAAAVGGYDSDVQLLAQGNNFTEAGQQADEMKAQKAAYQDCSSSSDYMCNGGFTYNVLDASGNGDTTQTDVLVCKSISYFAPVLLNLGNSASYRVIGRAAAAVLPALAEHFVPSTIDPQTGTPYQPTETQWASAYSGPAYDVDFSGLTVDLNWYAAGTIKPYASVGNYSC